MSDPLAATSAGSSLASLASPDALRAALATTYLAEERTALAAWLALELNKPMLVEGPPGVGKTDLARALAATLGRPLVRLQCYEGLDESRALYEWNHAKQMLYTAWLRQSANPASRDAGDAFAHAAALEHSLYDRRFLMARPLLLAVESDVPVVLLLDEVDRAEPEFEAFLLEFLAEGQVTVPELGTLRQKHAPLVLLTTNGTRDMTDALRRRCLHLFMEQPSPEAEQAILALRVPGLESTLAAALTEHLAYVRTLELRKPPSVSEAIDWARALLALGKRSLTRETLRETLAVLAKFEEDRALIEKASSSRLPA
jgi:MoxR-like ATPase